MPFLAHDPSTPFFSYFSTPIHWASLSPEQRARLMRMCPRDAHAQHARIRLGMGS